jgi:ubiquinol-cytochrome c reductase cytochrome c subunit
MPPGARRRPAAAPPPSGDASASRGDADGAAGRAASLRALGGFVALAAIVTGVLMLTGSWSGRAGGSTGDDAAAHVLPTLIPGATTVMDVAATARGRELFLSSCASCHGPDGRGSDDGPSLASSGPAAWDFYLRTGRMPLSAPGQPADRQGVALSQDDIDALVAYGATISRGPAVPDLVVDVASLQRGRDLFINTCAACHGATAGGGSVGPGVFAPALVGADPKTVAEAVRIGPGAMPPFAWDDGRLSDVAAYLDWLATAPRPGGVSTGGQGPVPEGLLAVLIGLGALVVLARWIGKPARPPDD